MDGNHQSASRMLAMPPQNVSTLTSTGKYLFFVARVRLRWEALEQILAVYVERSADPVTHYLEPYGYSSVEAADLVRMLKAVSEVWQRRQLPEEPILEAVAALRRSGHLPTT